MPVNPAPVPSTQPLPFSPSNPAPSGPYQPDIIDGIPKSSPFTCPPGYPVKGNISASGERIYHVPGGAFYNNTDPERCFATLADAAASGFRPSLRQAA